MKPILLVLTLALLCAGSPAFAADDKTAAPKPAATATATGLPSADEVLTKFVQALGGKAALEKLTSRSLKGTLELPALGASTPAEFLAKAPNKSWQQFDIPTIGKITEGYDGKVAWSESAFGSLDKTGAELAEVKRRSVFNRELKFKELYPKLQVLRKDKVGPRDVFVLEATPADGPPERWHFDAQSGLVVRHDGKYVTQFGEFEASTFFEDYREVDGVKLAFTIRRPEPEQMAFVVKFAEIKHNVPIDDAKFAKPAAQ
jgi:hypothetical protein